MQVLKNGDRFNFSDLMVTDTVAEVKDTIPEAPAKYIINDIRINGGYVKYTDEVLSNTIALNRLDLLIPGFTWNADSTNLDVNFRFVDGGGFFQDLFYSRGRKLAVKKIKNEAARRFSENRNSPCCIFIMYLISYIDLT